MHLLFLFLFSLFEWCHMDFTMIRNRRQADYLRQNVESFIIVQPQRVTAQGKVITNDVRLSVKRRLRRSKEDEETLHYRVPLPDANLTLKLTASSQLLAPGFIIETWRNNNTSTLKQTERRCLFSGVVNGTEKSYVAVATCSGLSGLIHTDNEDLFIEPVKGHEPNDRQTQPHVLYKRSALKNASKVGTCAVTENNLEAGRLKSENKEYRLKRKRSVSVERNVETLVVADKEMVDYYANEDIETYILTIMNMVSALFHDASIGNAINIVLVRMLLLESEQIQNIEEQLVINQHADETLKSFCQWQKSINPKDEDHPNHHDVAILLTRYNICSRSTEPCSTLGLAEVAGMCQPHRSCNVNEDTGLALAYTIAHEVGHNFGMSHDSPENGCEAPLGEKQHVMSPHLNSDASPFIWSNCSRWEITKFLDRDWGNCLDDKPMDHEFDFPELPPGAMYDADHQCRLQYGSDAEFCRDIEDVCQTLWCRQQNKCVTRLEPSAEGTICGKNMWCYLGECTLINERPISIDGEWGQWSPWSACSRSCGAGVQHSERDCDNPVPSRGGRFCIGERKRYKMCNIEKCPENTLSYRAQQCKEFNDIPYKGELYSWLPVSTPMTPCQLHCKPEGQFFSVMLSDAVKDGTECNPGTRDICINGKCRQVACDWVIDSTALEDRCGICHGDGTQCFWMKGEFTVRTGLGYVLVATIPKEARSILVEELVETTNYIAVQGEKGDFYLNGQWFIQWSGDYEAAGTTFYYLRDGDRETLKIPGPTKENIRILLLYQTENLGLVYEYTVPNKNMTRIPEFRWLSSEWSICSKTCGGGIKLSKVKCVEKEAGRVEDSYCNVELKPAQKTRACNKQKCPAKWWTGPWQKCSMTCGKSGIRRRAVICVRTLGSDSHVALLDKECSSSEKPSDQEICKNSVCPTGDGWETGQWTDVCHGEPCNFQSRHVFCSHRSRNCEEKLKPPSKRQCGNVTCGKWIVGAWSQCSASCGDGMRYRNVSCVGGIMCHKATEPPASTRCQMRRCSSSGYSSLQEDDDDFDNPNKLSDLENWIPVSDSVYPRLERTRKLRHKHFFIKMEDTRYDTRTVISARPEKVIKDIVYHPIYEILNPVHSNDSSAIQ